MLKASDFRAMHCVATMAGFGLTSKRGKLAAHLLERYGEKVDEVTDFGFTRRKQSFWDEFQLSFGPLGFLSVTDFFARVEFGCPEDREPTRDWIPAKVRDATELLATVFTFHKQRPLALSIELTYFLPDVSTDRLIDHLGVGRALGGLFASSEGFEVRGDTRFPLADLFDVECEVAAGRFFDFVSPENVGASLKFHSPDNRGGEGAPVDYTPELIARFFATAPQVMHEQLAKLFPGGEVP